MWTVKGAERDEPVNVPRELVGGEIFPIVDSALPSTLLPFSRRLRFEAREPFVEHVAQHDKVRPVLFPLDVRLREVPEVPDGELMRRDPGILEPRLLVRVCGDRGFANLPEGFRRAVVERELFVLFVLA